MHTIQVQVDETLTNDQLGALREKLMSIPYINDVSISPQDPHGFLVDFEKDHNTPISVVHELQQEGLHPDIVSC